MTALVDSSSSQFGNSGTSITWSHTCSGLDRAIIVSVFTNAAGQTATSVTYGGIAMTLIGGTSGTDSRIEQWKLSNPAKGANNVVISWPASAHSAAGAVSFTGAHNTTSQLTGTQTTNTGVGSSSTVDVSATSTQIILDCVGHAVYPDVTIVSAGAGQTSRFNIGGSLGAGVTNSTIAGSTKAGAATVTMTWTFSGSAGGWRALAVPIKPSSGSMLVAL